MRSTLPLLALLSTLISPATANFDDCDPSDDECLVQALVAEDEASLSESGLPGGIIRLDTLLNIDLENITSTNTSTNTTEVEEPRWACDLRAWTRAADLSPGAVVPAEARLAANGSACGDVVGWEVGLRFKERAIIKRKLADVHLPEKPKRPAWNASRDSGGDWNDVFRTSSGYFNPRSNREYEEAMREYNKLMGDEGLWEVKGHERVVFDITKKMELGSTDATDLDLMRDFAVHVPLTNLPPIDDYTAQGMFSGKDEQMVGTETLSEYYHLVHLANGSTIDIPSGRSGFVSLPSPVAPPSTVRDSNILNEIQWPLEVTFAPTKREKEKQEGEDFMPWDDHRIAPECDKYNQANFTLLISSNISQPVIGHNITFNFTLLRTGNGTEYPAYIDISHSTDKNLTYAWDFVSTEEEYLGLVSPSADKDDMRYSGRAQRMLMVPDQAALEKQRKRKEEMKNGGVFSSYSSSGRRMFPAGDGVGRYEFWTDDGLVEQDKFEFGVELPMNYKEYPSFEKTFETIRSNLLINLHTAFACQLHVHTPTSHAETHLEGDEEETKSELGRTEVDDEWAEYELPPSAEIKKRVVDWSGMSPPLNKRTSVPLDARLPNSTSTDDLNVEGSRFVHYLDPTALGPVMTDLDTTSVEFPLLNQIWREEDKDEKLKKRKWDTNHPARSNGWCRGDNDQFSRRGRSGPIGCWSMNGGGGAKHAARMWQAKEAKKRGEEVSKKEGDKGINGGGFIVQV